MHEARAMPSAGRTIDSHEARSVRASPPSPWTLASIEALFALPFPDLIFGAQQVHREHHPRNAVQLSTLLSIKTGGCPEDCGYCPQAKRYHTNVEDEALVALPRGSAAAMARSAASRARAGACNGARRESARDGNVLHARHAEGWPGGGAERSRARLLQPQPRYAAGVLRRCDHAPRLQGST